MTRELTNDKIAELLDQSKKFSSDANVSTFFSLLGDGTKSPADVYRACRKLIARYHPDTNVGASTDQNQLNEKKFKFLNNLNSLSDEDKQAVARKYTEMLEQQASRGNYAQQPNPGFDRAHDTSKTAPRSSFTPTAEDIRRERQSQDDLDKELGLGKYSNNRSGNANPWRQQNTAPRPDWKSSTTGQSGQTAKEQMMAEYRKKQRQQSQQGNTRGSGDPDKDTMGRSNSFMGQGDSSWRSATPEPEPSRKRPKADPTPPQPTTMPNRANAPKHPKSLNDLLKEQAQDLAKGYVSSGDYLKKQSNHTHQYRTRQDQPFSRPATTRPKAPTTPQPEQYYAQQQSVPQPSQPPRAAATSAQDNSNRGEPAFHDINSSITAIMKQCQAFNKELTNINNILVSINNIASKLQVEGGNKVSEKNINAAKNLFNILATKKAAYDDTWGTADPENIFQQPPVNTLFTALQKVMYDIQKQDPPPGRKRGYN